MFLWRSTYDKLLKEAVRDRTRADLYELQARRLEAEVRRLTNCILAMEKEGLRVHPRATDPAWSPYVMDEDMEAPKPPEDPIEAKIDAMALAEIRGNGRH